MIYTNPVPVSDFWEYYVFAENLLEEGYLGFSAPSAYRLPGYPAFLAFLMLFSKSATWLAAVNILLSTASVVLIYSLSKSLFGTTTARIASLATALNPTLVYFSPILASEHLAILLLLSGMILLFNVRINSQWKRYGIYLIAGLLFGAAVLVRGAVLFYAPAVLLIPYILKKQDRNLALTLGHYARFVIFLTIGFATMLAPWMIRNRIQVGTGAGLTTVSGLNFYFAHNDVRYGYHTFAKSPFKDMPYASMQDLVMKGGPEAAFQQTAYNEGWKYIRNSELSTLISDIWTGTEKLYLTDGKYAVEWSLRRPREGNSGSYPMADISGTSFFKNTTNFWFLLFFSLVPFCLFAAFARRKAEACFILLFVAGNWLGYAVIFWGKARYRYDLEILLTTPFAFIVSETCRRITVFFSSKS